MLQTTNFKRVFHCSYKDYKRKSLKQKNLLNKQTKFKKERGGGRKGEI